MASVFLHFQWKENSYFPRETVKQITYKEWSLGLGVQLSDRVVA
jgi:hypothetical protein